MTESRMPLREAVQVLHRARTDQVVITTMASAREWMHLGQHPLDFIYAPSSMGQAPTLGLGIALAQPQRQVIVCNGDGGMLMNLGTLVTITAEAPENYILIVFDNGMYEVTGMQYTAAAPAARRRNDPIAPCGIARSCGFRSVYEFSDLPAWEAGIADVLDAAGPTYVHLRVAPVPGAQVPRSPAPPPQRAREFAEALQQR